MGKHLQAAIDQGRAKPWRAVNGKQTFIIYPQRFMCSIVYEALLMELEPDYTLVQIWPGLIRAFPKK